MRIAIFASGYGSNLESILTAISNGECAAQCVCIVTDRKKSRARLLAQEHGIPCSYVPMKAYETRELWNEALIETLKPFDVQLVVLAGFMRLLGPNFIEAYENRIINIHPSLLPLFPGIDAPQQAIDSDVTLSGCTVHLVDNGIDTGAPLASVIVPVFADDTAEELHERIKIEERKLYPLTIHRIAIGEITLSSR